MSQTYNLCNTTSSIWNIAASMQPVTGSLTAVLADSVADIGGVNAAHNLTLGHFIPSGRASPTCCLRQLYKPTYQPTIWVCRRQMIAVAPPEAR